MLSTVTVPVHALQAAFLGDDLPMRERVMMIEQAIINHPQSLDPRGEDFPIEHSFKHGIYFRKVTIPAGMITVGKIHKHECINILERGVRATLIGDQIRLIRAPFSFVSPPGTKRVSYTYEDAVWVTVHKNPTDEFDVEKLERMLTAETEEEYRQSLALEGERPRCLS